MPAWDFTAKVQSGRPPFWPSGVKLLLRKCVGGAGPGIYGGHALRRICLDCLCRPCQARLRPRHLGAWVNFWPVSASQSFCAVATSHRCLTAGGAGHEAAMTYLRGAAGWGTQRLRGRAGHPDYRRDGPRRAWSGCLRLLYFGGRVPAITSWHLPEVCA